MTTINSARTALHSSKKSGKLHVESEIMAARDHGKRLIRRGERDGHGAAAFPMSIMEVLFGSSCLRDDPRIGETNKVCWEHVNATLLCLIKLLPAISTLFRAPKPIKRWIDRIFEILVSQYTCRKETEKLCHQNKGALILASKYPIESKICIYVMDPPGS